MPVVLLSSSCKDITDVDPISGQHFTGHDIMAVHTTGLVMNIVPTPEKSFKMSAVPLRACVAIQTLASTRFLPCIVCRANSEFLLRSLEAGVAPQTHQFLQDEH